MGGILYTTQEGDVMSVALTDLDYERMTAEYWASRVPGCDEVTIIVRSGDKMVRTIIVTPSSSASPVPVESE